MALITLTTDLGWGEYVAQMKVVMLELDPSAIVIDVSHEVTPHNVREGAYLIYSVVKHLKDGIHVGVVDPTVGTARRPILFDCERGKLVGPDNGLLVPAAKELGLKHAYVITNRKMMRKEVHPTFHGRDIFAPVAANLSLGAACEEVGEEIDDWVELDFGGWRLCDDKIEAEIIHIDRFGNLITNIPARAVTDHLKPGNTYRVTRGRWSGVLPYVEMYAAVDVGEILITVSSSGHLEIARREGNAKERLQAKIGDSVSIALE